MTTIPGHNIVVQQSAAVHEATHHVRPNRPDPEQLAQQQALKVNLEKTMVAESSDPQKMEADRKKKREARRRSILTKVNKKMEREQEPDETGNLLDTTA